MKTPVEEKPALRRFYKTAAYRQADGEPGFCIVLDGRQVRTPAKAVLQVPSEPLAKAIAAEWDAQGDTVKPETMALTQIAGTAIDKVMVSLEENRAVISGYAQTDLLCYRAEGPVDLVAHQHKTWQPYLDWLARRFDAPLRVTSGILALEQPAESLASLESHVDRLEPFPLTALSLLTHALGSLVLGLAVADQHASPKRVWEAAFLDEIWQEERWGQDEEAGLRRAALLADIEDAARFLSLLK
ncbi:MAG: ATP12 family protein [Pseudomonadota bacterium]